MTTATISEPSMREDTLISAEEFLEREMGPANGRTPSGFAPKHVPASTPHIPVDGSSPLPVDAPYQMPVAEAPARDPRSKVLPRLMRMADSYLRTGALRQALEMYFDLYRNHEGSPEAAKAEDRILEVAAIHEENGELHLARAIYEQLI